MDKRKRCWIVLVLITVLVVCFSCSSGKPEKSKNSSWWPIVGTPPSRGDQALSGAAYADEVDDLIRQLGSDDIYVRFKAAKSLGFQGVNLKSR